MKARGTGLLEYQLIRTGDALIDPLRLGESDRKLATSQQNRTYTYLDE